MDEGFSYLTDPWVPATTPDDFRIRLIELQSSHNQGLNAPLRCRIFWTPLSACLSSFEAISYVWGSDPPSHTIYIADKVASITPSLEVALRHIRHESHPVTIWVDQLCINQQDDEEKTQQVRNMDRIYRAASEVIIWLGLAADGSDRFMDIWAKFGTRLIDWGLPGYFDLEKIGDLVRILGPEDRENLKSREWYALIREFADSIDEALLRSLIAWENRPWFTRIWVSMISLLLIQK